MKKLLKVLSGTLAVMMIIMSLPVFVSAAETSADPYPYKFKGLTNDWYCNGVGAAGGSWANGGNYATSWDKDNKIAKIDMKKPENNKTCDRWGIGLTAYYLNQSGEDFNVSGISETGAVKMDIKIENLENASSLKFFITAKNYAETARVAIPGASSITSDDEWHTVYIPLSGMASGGSGVEAMKQMSYLGVTNLNTTEQTWVHIKNVEFVTSEAVSLKANIVGDAVSLNWTCAPKAFVATGYKIFKNTTEIANVEASVSTYTDTLDSKEAAYTYYQVVPYNEQGDMSQYMSNRAMAASTYYKFKGFSNEWYVTDKGGIGGAGNGYDNGKYYENSFAKDESGEWVAKVSMKKPENNQVMEAWRLGVQSWYIDSSGEYIELSPISEIGAVRMDIKIEGIENASALNFSLVNKSYNSTPQVKIPGGENITSDGKWHTVYLPLSEFASGANGEAALDQLREIRFKVLNTTDTSYLYMKNVDFVVPTAVAVKAKINDGKVNLSWIDVKKTGKYKVLKDGEKIGEVTEATSALTDKQSVYTFADSTLFASDTTKYEVVPFNDNGDLTEYQGSVKVSTPLLSADSALFHEWGVEVEAADIINGSSDYTVSMKVYNSGKTALAPVYLVAVYADGILDGVYKTETVETIESGASKILEANVETPEEGVITWKAFIFKDEATLSPVSTTGNKTELPVE